MGASPLMLLTTLLFTFVHSMRSLNKKAYTSFVADEPLILKELSRLFSIGRWKLSVVAVDVRKLLTVLKLSTLPLNPNDSTDVGETPSLLESFTSVK